jgi:hypothetical protein
VSGGNGISYIAPAIKKHLPFYHKVRSVPYAKEDMSGNWCRLQWGCSYTIVGHASRGLPNPHPGRIRECRREAIVKCDVCEYDVCPFHAAQCGNTECTSYLMCAECRNLGSIGQQKFKCGDKVESSCFVCDEQQIFWRREFGSATKMPSIPCFDDLRNRDGLFKTMGEQADEEQDNPDSRLEASNNAACV